jgi:hypothetical protein
LKKRLENKIMECGEDQLIEIEMMGCALLQFIGEMHQCIAYIQIIDSRIGRDISTPYAGRNGQQDA